MAEIEMSYAQALNEARQVIIQQSSRIKGDLEKIKGQQQTICDQAARASESEARISEQSSEISRLVEQLQGVQQRYSDAEAGRQQAEGMVNRQGEKINHLEAQVADFLIRLDEANSQIAELTRDRDELRSQLPTTEDIEALNGMMALLSQKRGNCDNASQPSMRIVAEAA